MEKKLAFKLFAISMLLTACQYDHARMSINRPVLLCDDSAHSVIDMDTPRGGYVALRQMEDMRVKIREEETGGVKVFELLDEITHKIQFVDSVQVVPRLKYDIVMVSQDFSETKRRKKLSFYIRYQKENKYVFFRSITISDAGYVVINFPEEKLELINISWWSFIKNKTDSQTIDVPVTMPAQQVRELKASIKVDPANNTKSTTGEDQKPKN